MTTDRALLAEYVTKGSEEAFREVVVRYVDLVYSAAVRLADGDAPQAEDIVQTVFADLARLAGTLSQEATLGGWLHRRTCHVGASTMRRERRRWHRERQAAEMNALSDHTEPIYEHLAPVLDEAINQLSAKDRTAIVLRFFENRDLRSVGAVLGSNEDAAQKRVARALEKLRGLLRRRGVKASTAALAAVLGTHAVTAAPAGMALGVANAAMAGATAGGSLTLTLIKLMAMTKFKVAVGLVVAAGIGTTLLVEHQALARLRERNLVLNQRVAQVTLQQEERRSLPAAPAEAGAAGSQAAARAQDLDRLRGEAGALRGQAGQAARLRSENHKLRVAAGEPEGPAEAEFQKDTTHRLDELKQWGLRFFLFVNDHAAKDRFPETWDEVADRLPADQRKAVLGFAKDNFEIVYHGPAGYHDPAGLAKPGQTLLFREKQARRSPTGQWVKIYGFADGHVESHAEPENNFEGWENQYSVETK